ncbi:MATE family efflux transporter [Pseudosulfitobacter sp. DSM 107133]|uniref:MATE family efflux transporter n=1 Tax=Pseudosulfitobacter sp. DSM 107133 TaxID=2883100 RepID=UPI001F084A6C|nr:MATE family efflux transporter [Pseudosulfitobacter sp. DSM 107133]UOA26420.1 Multidrug resistance protein MdtK [Pseudosulfitobacter sp. DSM 107133]
MTAMTQTPTPRMTYPGHARTMLTLGLPLIGGHIAQMAIAVTDTVMLGWYGIEALAAVTLASTYFFLLFLMGSGFAWAVMPLVASFDAEGDETSLRRVTRMGLWLSTGFGILVLPVMIWAEPVLRMLGQTEQVARDGALYLGVAGWGMIPALLVMVMKSYLAALGRTQIVLWITLGAALVNGLANYALIFGNWGAPELGVRGAAIASVATQVFSLAGVILYALRVLPEHQIFVRLWRPDWHMLARVFRMGLPIGITSLSEVGLFSASAVMMGWLGTVPLAAHGIAVQLAGLAFMVHLGLSNVATIRAGNALGRRDAAHMARGARTAFALSLGMSVLTSTVFLLFPEALISAFVQSGEPARDQIMAIGVGLLAVAALFQLVDGVQVIALGLLRGVQDTSVPMVLAAVSYWVVGLPTAYLLGFVLDLGGVGVWFGLVVGLGAAALSLAWRFWRVSFPKVERA